MTLNKIPEISLVIPLYNEAAVFDKLITRLNTVMDMAQMSCEVVLVDDGSTDVTADLIESTALKDDRYYGVFLSRNFGHQIALSAGLSKARGTQAIFILDGDLQDPPELLTEFYNKLKEGFDVVYAIRTKRKESLLKRIGYKYFYRFLDKISYIKIPLDSGDYGMVSRRVVNQINSMPEHSRYIRGMRSWVGFKQVGIEYDRDERQDGESKYSIKQLFKLASEGIFNFSEFPIRFITRLGIITLTVSVGYLITVLVKRFLFDSVPEGFTALLIAIIMFSGVILISIGILGEYILRIFFETKNRPLFVIDKEIKDGKEL